MGDELPVTVRRERGVVIAEVTGDIDMSTAPALRERLSGLAGSGQPLVVDLNRITFIDSTGLGALVGVARHAEAHGGSLHAVCSRPQARKLLWLTGVDRRIPLTATVDGALMLLTASRDDPASGRQRRGEDGARPLAGGSTPAPSSRESSWASRGQAHESR